MLIDISNQRPNMNAFGVNVIAGANHNGTTRYQDWLDGILMKQGFYPVSVHTNQPANSKQTLVDFVARKLPAESAVQLGPSLDTNRDILQCTYANSIIRHYATWRYTVVVEDHIDRVTRVECWNFGDPQVEKLIHADWNFCSSQLYQLTTNFQTNRNMYTDKQWCNAFNYIKGQNGFRFEAERHCRAGAVNSPPKPIELKDVGLSWTNPPPKKHIRKAKVNPINVPTYRFRIADSAVKKLGGMIATTISWQALGQQGFLIV
jgi:hypothetical protein